MTAVRGHDGGTSVRACRGKESNRPTSHQAENLPENTGSGGYLPERGTWRSPPMTARGSPSLLCCLAGDTEPGRDLSPGVPGLPEPGDGLGDRLVQLGGEPGHVGQSVDVAGRDSPGVGAYDAPDEAAYSSFSTGRRRRFGVNLALTLDRLPRLACT